MRSRATIATLLAVAAFGLPHARGQVAGGELRELFQRLDANNDQTIEASEVPEAASAAFDKLLRLGDTNKNGKLEADELRELARHMAAGQVGGGAGPAARIKAMDKDKDGRVSKSEFTGIPANFDRFDKNKDGFIDADELKALNPAAGAPAVPAAGMAAIDKNGDGKISREEFPGPAAAFDRLDTNKDGQLDKDEAAKLATLRNQRLNAMDKNGDKKLSRDEYQGPPALFDRLDADKDGFVSFEELKRLQGMFGGDAKPKAKAEPEKKAEAKKPSA